MASSERSEPNIAGRLLGVSRLEHEVDDLERQIRVLGQNVSRLNRAFGALPTGLGSGMGVAGAFPAANRPTPAGTAQATSNPSGTGTAVQQAAAIMRQRMEARRAQQNEAVTRAAEQRRQQEEERRRQRDQAQRDRQEANARHAAAAEAQQQAMREAQERARQDRERADASARARITARLGGAGGVPPRPTVPPTVGAGQPGRGGRVIDGERLAFGAGQLASRAVSWGAGKVRSRVDHMTDQAYEMDRYAAFAYSSWADPKAGYWSQKNRFRNDAMQSSTALSTEDLNTGLFEVDRRLGMGRSEAERRLLHQQASGYALLDPTMGVADSARMMTAMYTPQASMLYQAMGLGPTIGAGGKRISQGQLNQNLLDRVFQRGYRLKNVLAASEQGGSLRTTLEGQARQLGMGQDWVENRLTQIQSQARWREQTGGSVDEYERLLRDAGGTGEKAEQARERLQKGGLDVDNLLNQKKRREGEERRHDSQMMDAFAPAMQAATDVVIDFKEALNAILELPGVKHVVGGYQGVDAGTGGRLTGALKGAGVGALTGLAAGSVIPGIGNGVGALAGGIIGGIGGLIGGGAAGGGSIGGGAAGGSGGSKTRANLHQGSANSAIKAALSQIGVDYSWGGGGPEGPSRGFAQGARTVGFDCSSLMQYAFSKVGVRLGRTTYEQLKAGKGVAYKDRRPGDLMFPNSGHVVMYLGNGKIVHAPRTGQKIRVDSEDHFGKYMAVRRVVAGGGDTFSSDEPGSTSSEAGAGNDNSAATGASTTGTITNAYGSVNEVEALAAALSAGGRGAAGAGGGSKKSGEDGRDDPAGADVDTGGYSWGAINGRYTKVPAPPGWVKAAIQRGMAAKGVSGAAWARGLTTIAYRESGYRRDARNDWDSNAKNGDPSVGLFQVIGSTFKAYRAKSLPNDQTDPAASAAAAIGWIKARYGSIGKVQQADPNKPSKGYEIGAWDLPEDEITQVHKGEMIVPKRTAQTIRNALMQESIPVKSTTAAALEGPKRASAAGGGGGVTVQFGQGAISITVQGAMSSSAAMQAGRQIVDAIAADKRLKEIGAGV
ncbi:NlpC/P60 family protein [Streptomyces rimosus]|uniref:NlpC/P60 family protein n=1 Tax=Streptomyces rimosus TaxID=1927 RepID=UPI00067B9853|nr:NlpC/P60 family protein [Streptomyces rimosus]